MIDFKRRAAGLCVGLRGWAVWCGVAMAMAACSSSPAPSGGGGDSGTQGETEVERPVDVEPLRAVFLSAVEALVTAQERSADATCQSGAHAVQFDTTRAVAKKIVSEVLDMATVLGMMAGGDWSWSDWFGQPGGQQGGAIDEEAAKEGLRIMLGNDPFDPMCEENGSPRIPVDAEAVVAWIAENVVADSLIIAHTPEQVVFRLDGDTVCRLVNQSQGDQNPDEDAIAACIQKAERADIRLALRPGKSDDAIDGAVTAGADAAHLLSLVVDGAGDITSDMDLSDAQLLLTLLSAEGGSGGGASADVGTEFRGRVATRWVVLQDETVHMEVSIVEALHIFASVPDQDGGNTGNVTLSVGPTSPFFTSDSSPQDGCARSGFHVNDVSIRWEPVSEDGATGPLTITLPGAGADLVACGESHGFRILGLGAGSATTYIRSGGQTVCALDINHSSGATSDVHFEKRDGTHYATAMPELDFSLQCQPVDGALPASMRGLLRDYEFQLTEGEWMSLEPKGTLITWLLNLLLGL